MTQTIKNITLLMAMQAEAQPIIDELNLIEQESVIHSKLPMRCFQNKVDNLNISLIVSGIDPRYQVDNIGSEAATLMAYEAITKLNPDLLISAGTAGGFASKGAQIGTVYISDKHFIYHDRHVPIPNFKQSAIGLYPAAEVNQLAKDLKLPQGIISTGSSLEKDPKDVAIIEQYNASAKEMEAAAIAWVAMLFEIPFFALKSITNLLDEANKSEQEFVKNLAFSSSALQQRVLEVIEYLNNKTLKDLK